MTGFVLDYARRHGLAIDHRAERLESYLASCARCLPPMVDGLPEFEALSPQSLFQEEERFELSQEASRILAQAVRSPTKPGWDYLIEDPHKTEKLKLEVPLLRADHMRDMKWFRSKLELDRFLDEVRQTVQEVNLDSIHLPDFQVSCSTACDEVRHEVQNERLEVNKKVLDLLAETTRRGHCPNEGMLWMQDCVSSSTA